jgi:DNA-directed RNA polymerase subunit RPC12/RpoP
MDLGIKILLLSISWVIIGGGLALLAVVHSGLWLIALLVFFVCLISVSSRFRCPNCQQKIYGIDSKSFKRLNEWVFGVPIKCGRCGHRYFD